MTEMDEKKAIEQIINITYPGVTMLYRDANLGSIAKLYKEDMIIKERAFTDASRRGGGMITTHRYVILSNCYMDASEFEKGSNWGLCIMQSGSHFKVLDVYSKQEKTQVTLLHLPEKHWEVFTNVKTNLDEQLVLYTRKRFDELLTSPPVAELATDKWLERCSFPLGMDTKGNFYPLGE
jgi:hypothetical protein